jgi:ABC transporter DrrB family efflux protein
MGNKQILVEEKGSSHIHSAFYWAFSDTIVMAKREFKRVGRNSDEMLGATLVPILFFMVFRFVFGWSISIPGTSYVNYLTAGLLTMSVMFGSASTALGLVTDLGNGIIDRFASLPMARSAILTGRTLSTLVRNLINIIVVGLISFLLGFRPTGSIVSCLMAVGLLLLGCLTFSWFFILLGLSVKSLEMFSSVAPIFTLAFVFFSSGLAPTNNMPHLLRIYIEHQPVSLLINAVRGLLLNQTDTFAIWQTIIWFVPLLFVFIPISVRIYKQRTV